MNNQPHIKTKDMILVSIFAALMAVGAFVKVAFPVIPLSLQPFICALAGIILGARLGALSQLVYILIGLFGIPVFTMGGGPSYILKPSFGFIIGFAAGTYIIGKVCSRFRTLNFVNAAISAIAGLAAIYAIGLPYMYLILRFYMNKPEITWATVLAAGFFPFIIKDLIMYLVAAAVAVAVVPALKKAQLSS